MKSLIFLTALTLTSLPAQTVLDFGTSKISGSTTGLSDSHPNLTGDALGAGVSFDLTVIASDNSASSLTINSGPDGIGVSTGANALLDNKNDLDPSNDETLTFTLSNITGLTGDQSLKITGIRTLFGVNTANEQYSLSDGNSGTFTDGNQLLAVDDQSSVTITATGPTTGTASRTEIAIDELHLEIIDSTPPPPVDPVDLDVTSGIDNDGVYFISFNSTFGESYEVQSSPDFLSWTPCATLSGTGSQVSYRNPSISPLTSNFFRLKVIETPNGNLQNASVLTGNALTFNQTWSEETSGYDRTVEVEVPTSGSGPFPVVILIHGSGGTASNFINNLDPLLDHVIRVAPQGYGTQWNIDAEPLTEAPDVEFFESLIAHLKTYDNVDAGNITVLGSSNGSGMVNRLIIELNGAAFQNAVGFVSQMITKMYPDGTFRADPLGDHSYSQIVTPAPGRRIFNVNGGTDPLVPYYGGFSPQIGTTFVDSQESIYRFAQAMGETGPQIPLDSGPIGEDITYPTGLEKYSYLNGQVVHYKIIGGGHGLAPYKEQIDQMVIDFLQL